MNAVRRFIAIIVCLVFVAGGLLSQACMAAQVAPASAPAVAQAPAAHHDHAAHRHDGGHDHASHAAHAAPQPHAPSPLPSDHQCQACCAFCMIASVARQATATDVAFVTRAYSLSFAQQDLTGSIILLDPGIPKRIL